MPARPYFNESQVNLINGRGRSREGSDSSSILSSSSTNSDVSIRSGSTNYPPANSYTIPQRPQIATGTSFSIPPVDGPEAVRVPLPEIRRQAPILPSTHTPLPIKNYQPRTQRSSHNRPQCLLRRRTLILLSAFSFTLSVTAVTLLAVIFANQSTSSWEDNTFPEGRYEVCIECLKLKMTVEDGENPLMKQLITKVVTNGKTTCCARTSGQISALVELMMRRSKEIIVQQAYSAEDPYRFSPVSAHVIFKAPDVAKDVQFNESQTLKIDTQVITDRRDPRTHVREVTVGNNSLTIQHTGWYFVYSSVYFRPTPDRKCKEFKYQTWGNFIMRLSPNRPDKSGCLTKTAQTCCDNCETEHQSSYTGGVFSLSRGDAVYVEISGGGLVKYDKDATFMGLVMLGSNVI